MPGCTDEFNPRYDAKSRTYRYYFSEVPSGKEEMGKASRHFLGIHDFSHFARVRDKNPLRNILSTRIGEEDGFVFFEVTAESFLWHQVRCMAAALLRVGSGEISGGVHHRLSAGELLTDHCLLHPPKDWCSGIRTAVWTGHRSQKANAAQTLWTISARHHALMEKVCSVLRQP